MAQTPLIDPSLSIGSVRLDVADLNRSTEFYERVLGLPRISREQNVALLGADARHPVLELHALAEPTHALTPHSTGLFHVAWLHPSRAALAETVRRVAGARWPIDGASDHGVSEALYLSDPDGLGIEIYADRPRETWQRPPGGHGVVMVTLALDIDDLLAQAPAAPSESVTPGTSIGHVHLKVADVPQATAFYREVLGFEEQALLPSAAFLSAGGYHHHIGLNSWQSAGASASPPNAPGLREIGFQVATDSVALDDPDGIRLRFAAKPGSAAPSSA
jgi:catechol 2,3-dioxygenase